MVHEPLDLLAESALAERLADVLDVPAVDLVDRIQERLELLGGYLRELRRLRDRPLASYLDHDVYAEHGVIDESLAGRLRGLAGLRNRLVHVYDTIDDARVHVAMSTGLPHLEAFATAIAALASDAG